MVSQGRYDEAAILSTAAEAYYRDTEALPDAVGDDFLGHARFHLGLIVWAQGDDVRVRSLLREAVARHDRVGAPTEAIDPLR
jgi:hypothetical protein